MASATESGQSGLRATAPEPVEEKANTRERILDIALELFTVQGYDKTSLRQIAEQLGFSKAAIYYHFASKEDIFMALHMRLHEFGLGALSMLDAAEMTPEAWMELVDHLTDQILAHRSLFVLHERNRAALEELHRAPHDASHEDLEIVFRKILSDPTLAARDRVRMACTSGLSWAPSFSRGMSLRTSTRSNWARSYATLPMTS
jgi:AcrR family transcriptional regulator